MNQSFHHFTTLRQPVEKLLESEYFLARLTRTDGLEFQFELNAFLSACRSVTFVLQKAFSGVENFADWYNLQRDEMSADEAMRFFLELRNISQKEGPVSFVGGSLRNGGWTYRFIGRPQRVPKDLVGRDIGACCAEHLAKLGKLILQCVEEFPFHSCPSRAFSEEGMATLGFSWRDVEITLGLPEGYTEVADIPASDKFRILRREVEPLDMRSLSRIAACDLRCKGDQLTFPLTQGTDLVDDVAAGLTVGTGEELHAREAFLNAVFKRIHDQQSP